MWCKMGRKTPDDGQWNCPKHVEFHSKTKFEKLVHLFGFIIRTDISTLGNLYYFEIRDLICKEILWTMAWSFTFMPSLRLKLYL